MQFLSSYLIFGRNHLKCGSRVWKHSLAQNKITSDQTKYDYIVSILDIDTADEMQSILIHPPNDDKYNTLKNALINIYSKSQLQKDFELLSLDGLGDRRPSALMRKIEALNDDPKNT